MNLPLTTIPMVLLLHFDSIPALRNRFVAGGPASAARNRPDDSQPVTNHLAAKFGSAIVIAAF
jgi:hypothetical protein